MTELTHCRLLVFAKAPVPGATKTRLCPPLTPASAAQLSRAMTRHALRAASRANLGPIELWCTPDITDDFFRTCAQEFNCSLHVQPSGDVGARMNYALHQALTRSDMALLVGSDCPSISADYLQQAAQLLAQGTPVVFGPAEDGGYGLIGVRGTVPAIFHDMPWGTDAVMNATRARLSASGLSWLELATMWDVDRPADLRRLDDDADLRYLIHGLTN